MEYVVLVNRTSKILQGTWDGRHHDIAPGKHSFPRIQAEKFRVQNPVMGSEDPRTLQCEYLIGIEENNDDCSPIEQTPALTRENLAVSGKSYEIVRGNGLYQPAIDSSAPLPVDGQGFVKP